MTDQIVDLVPARHSSVSAKRPKADRIAHIVLRTKNVRELVEWYTTVFQCTVIYESEALVFLAFDGEHHRFAIGTPPGVDEPDHMAAGIDHVAFTFSTLGGLLVNYEYLKSVGISPYWCIDHGMTISMYYHDPDGNQIELQVDRFPDTASAQEHFRSAAFAQNPVGIPFDGDKMLELLNAGGSEARLMQAPPHI